MIGTLGTMLYQKIDSLYFSGTVYYTKIVDDGKKVESKTNNGEVVIDYEYNQVLVDENGNKITRSFFGNKDRPLKKNRYMSLIVNDKKGVMRWQEVKKSEVPTKAINILK